MPGSDVNLQLRLGQPLERLMQAYFREDPLYQERFSQVWLWKEWVPHFNEESARRAARHPESGPPQRFDLKDTGIDPGSMTVVWVRPRRALPDRHPAALGAPRALSADGGGEAENG